MTALETAENCREGKEEARIVPFPTELAATASPTKCEMTFSELHERDRAMNLEGLESWLALTNAAAWLHLAEAEAEKASRNAGS